MTWTDLIQKRMATAMLMGLCALPISAQTDGAALVLADVETLAEQGDAAAMVAYALALLDGSEVGYDAARAGALASAAAAAGHRQGKLLLSVMLENGLGMAPDPTRAQTLLHDLALSGEPNALFHRAMQTAEISPAAALSDLQLAGAQGHVSALQVLATLRDWQENPALVPTPTGSVPDVDRNVLIAIQALLNQLGYDAGFPDGHLTTQTTAAIEVFQRTENLTPDGLATVQLRDLLIRAVQQ